MKIYWTKEAMSCLQKNEASIAQDNLLAAAEFVDKLISAAETLVNHPEKGRVVSELALENIRELLYKNYRIVYLTKEKSIDILTVFEGYQL
ncbi:MAG: type II toxin-antitoxin system RelE/ParE family toxin [Ignavibacteriales bacterium]|nr:type II toxin-antitoxin system RelE/ParE family toxin [Ignavibacteriales bacterium]